ncbi:ATP-dependent DNA helicase, partial [Aphis craccivora]
MSNKSYWCLCERAIIPPRNVTAEEINGINLLNYPLQFLNSFSGLLPHKLKLKVSSPITLLRNLQPPNLCKGSLAITIKKAQGLTSKYVGVNLRSEYFSHGQLYVGFSRNGYPNHLMTFI